MLQSSAKDRRAIFEEAAGISRFKAKKIEALRRLERVEQNLLRLSDIVDEVESRLKSVRAQAAKARRYKEYADRLQELRTQVGLADWRRLGDKLTPLKPKPSRCDRKSPPKPRKPKPPRESRSVGIANHRASTKKFTPPNQRWPKTASAPRRSKPPSSKSAPAFTIWKIWPRGIASNCRPSPTAPATWPISGKPRSTEVQAAETKHRELGNQLADQQRALTALTAQLDQIRSENEQRRSSHLEQLRTSAALTSEISTLEGRLSRTEEARERCQNRLAELQSARERIEQDFASSSLRQQELAERLGRTSRRMDRLARRFGRSPADNLPSVKKNWPAGANASAAPPNEPRCLEELEKRHEGVGAGAKEVLQFARENPDGPFKQVRGLLADLVQVSVETAPLDRSRAGRKGTTPCHLPRQAVVRLSLRPRQTAFRPRRISCRSIPAARRAATSISRPESASSAVPIGLSKPRSNLRRWSVACWAAPGSSKISTKPWHSAKRGPRRELRHAWPANCWPPTARSSSASDTPPAD